MGIENAFKIDIERCPPEHVGLGTGTQLGLAAPVLRRVPQHCEVALEVYANDGVPVRFAGVGQVAAADEAGIVDRGRGQRHI